MKGALQPVDATEQRAFPRPTPSDYGHDLAGLDRKRDPSEGLMRAEALRDVF